MNSRPTIVLVVIAAVLVQAAAISAHCFDNASPVAWRPSFTSAADDCSVDNSTAIPMPTTKLPAASAHVVVAISAVQITDSPFVAQIKRADASFFSLPVLRQTSILRI